MGGFVPCSTPNCHNPANKGHTKCSQCRYRVRRGVAEAPKLAADDHLLIYTRMRLDESVSPAQLVFHNGERVNAPAGLTDFYELEALPGRQLVWRVMVRIKKSEAQVTGQK